MPSFSPPAASSGTPRLQEAFLPNPVTPISAPSNTGDGLELGLAAGATVTTMRSVWGVPVLQDPAHVYDGHPSGRMANVELTLPGSVMVNSAGRRFVNEAVNYHDLNRVFRTVDPSTGEHANIPAWLVVDAAYVSRYSIGGTPAGRSHPGPQPAAPWPTSPRPVDSTPTGSPRRFGVQQARRRRPRPPVSPRGERADRYLGDARQPHPCLAPLTAAPYHAIPIRPGTLGTCGGLVTDDDGRVLPGRPPGPAMSVSASLTIRALPVTVERYPSCVAGDETRPNSCADPATPDGRLRITHYVTHSQQSFACVIESSLPIATSWSP